MPGLRTSSEESESSRSRNCPGASAFLTLLPPVLSMQPDSSGKARTIALVGKFHSLTAVMRLLDLARSSCFLFYFSNFDLAPKGMSRTDQACRG